MRERSVLIRPMKQQEATVCEKILRSLPDWFGIEESIVGYCRDIEAMETFVAEVPSVVDPASSGGGQGSSVEGDRSVVGFLTLHQHNEFSAEIHVMAVRSGQHGAGVGRVLVEHAQSLLCEPHVEFLETETSAASSGSESYDRTRGFYVALGFRPLEENDLWGEDNPCLIMIQHLACRPDFENQRS